MRVKLRATFNNSGPWLDESDKYILVCVFFYTYSLLNSLINFTQDIITMQNDQISSLPRLMSSGFDMELQPQCTHNLQYRSKLRISAR